MNFLHWTFFLIRELRIYRNLKVLVQHAKNLILLYYDASLRNCFFVEMKIPLFSIAFDRGKLTRYAMMVISGIRISHYV